MKYAKRFIFTLLFVLALSVVNNAFAAGPPGPPTGGGGGAPPYKAETDPEPPCDVRVKKVYIVDEKTDNIEHIVVVKDVWIE